MMKRKRAWVSAAFVLVAGAAAGAIVIMMKKSPKTNTLDPDEPGVGVTNDEELPPTDASVQPSLIDFGFPSISPSAQPSFFKPISDPSAAPIAMTVTPSSQPSVAPSSIPTSRVSSFPTVTPSSLPTQNPSSPPSYLEGCNRVGATASCSASTFYAIADVPYSDEERLALPQQILSVPQNADFLIHLGDIRSARDEGRCELNEYKVIASILKLSKVPVFLVLGDNEWNDCSNIDEGWSYWGQELAMFENHWSHDLNVVRPPGRTESFAFVLKRALYVGLNLVAGLVHNETEWIERLTDQAVWTTDLMRAHTGGNVYVEQIRSVVIFGHAHPTAIHNYFFLPLKKFIRDELARDIPVMYMNGDSHVWAYNSTYLGEDQMIRIQLTGGTSEPPLQVVVAPTDDAATSTPDNVFLYDRGLPPTFPL